MKTQTTALALCLAGTLLGSFGCGTQFDTIDQLDGLRVLAVQKDRPYAQPGDQVELRMLYHDTGERRADEAEGDARPISVVWLSGCTNPPADLYAGCLGIFQEQLDGVDGPFSDLEPDELEQLLSGAQEQGLGFGMGEQFRFTAPEDVLSIELPDGTREEREYGLNYVFFAACAGELRFQQGGNFPIACYDGDEELGAKDFVAGYTAVYSYASYTNDNPEILGIEVAGQKVPEDRVCIGAGCETLTPDPERECGPDDPTVKRCEDTDAIGTCDKIELRLLVDPKSVDLDEVLSAREGAKRVEEQMWANFHTDRGKFTYDVALVNDLNVGFTEEQETAFIAPEVPGPAQIWAVVRDNRSGVQWLRTQVCVTD